MYIDQIAFAPLNLLLSNAALVVVETNEIDGLCTTTEAIFNEKIKVINSSNLKYNGKVLKTFSRTCKLKYSKRPLFWSWCAPSPNLTRCQKLFRFFSNTKFYLVWYNLVCYNLVWYNLEWYNCRSSDSSKKERIQIKNAHILNHTCENLLVRTGSASLVNRKLHTRYRISLY